MSISSLLRRSPGAPWLAITLAACLAVPASAAAGGRVPGTKRGSNKLHTRRLPNGLIVIVEEDHRAPYASLALWYGVGSRDDPPGKSGLAGMTAWMSHDESQHVPRDSASALLNGAGARSQSNTNTLDYTHLSVTLPAERISLPLWLWSDQMGYFVSAAEESCLAANKQVVADQWSHRVVGSLGGQLNVALSTSTFPASHPYHRFGLSDPVEAATIQLVDVQRFHQQWFVPNNAVLAISGHIEPEAVLASVDRYFGPILPGPPVSRPSIQPASLAEETWIEAEAPMSRTMVQLSWPTPALEAEGDHELDMVATILDGQSVAWLTWELVDKLKLADDVDAAQHSSELASWFQISVTVAEGRDPMEAVKKVDEAIERLATSGPTERDVVEAVNDIAAKEVFRWERPSARVARYAACQFRFGDPDCALWRLERLDNTRVDPIKRAAAGLRDSGRVVQIIRATAGAPTGGHELSRRTRRKP